MLQWCDQAVSMPSYSWGKLSRPLPFYFQLWIDVADAPPYIPHLIMYQDP